MCSSILNQLVAKVFLIQIKVYSAPHLSTPSCLAEPSAEYDLDTLPSRYWKLYNDAAELVTRIKERTPRVKSHNTSFLATVLMITFCLP
jgi:polo-like kinase 4